MLGAHTNILAVKVFWAAAAKKRGERCGVRGDVVGNQKKKAFHGGCCLLLFCRHPGGSFFAIS